MIEMVNYCLAGLKGVTTALHNFESLLRLCKILNVARPKGFSTSYTLMSNTENWTLDSVHKRDSKIENQSTL